MIFEFVITKGITIVAAKVFMMLPFNPEGTPIGETTLSTPESRILGNSIEAVSPSTPEGQIVPNNMGIVNRGSEPPPGHPTASSQGSINVGDGGGMLPAGELVPSSPIQAAAPLAKAGAGLLKQP